MHGLCNAQVNAPIVLLLPQHLSSGLTQTASCSSNVHVIDSSANGFVRTLSEFWLRSL